MMDGDWNGWAWWSMAIAMMVFWGLVAWVVVTVMRRSTGTVRSAQSQLDERYARGEIDTEEYQARRDALRD